MDEKTEEETRSSFLSDPPFSFCVDLPASPQVPQQSLPTLDSATQSLLQPDWEVSRAGWLANCDWHLQASRRKHILTLSSEVECHEGNNLVRNDELPLAWMMQNERLVLESKWLMVQVQTRSRSQFTPHALLCYSASIRSIMLFFNGPLSSFIPCRRVTPRTSRCHALYFVCDYLQATISRSSQTSRAESLTLTPQPFHLFPLFLFLFRVRYNGKRNPMLAPWQLQEQQFRAWQVSPSLPQQRLLFKCG